MKFVALHSSARRGGNTEQIVRLAGEQLHRLADAAGAPLQFESVALSDLNLAMCRGCRACFDRGEEKCPLKDGLSDLTSKLLDADGVIFASPVYVEDVNAVMKNFIDRMAFNCHRPAFAGKTAFIVTTSGSGSTNHSVRTVKYALGSWGFHITGYRKYRMGALMDAETARVKYGKSVDGFAEELFRTVHRK
jgi:multimeric flavodoxin WrbA